MTELRIPPAAPRPRRRDFGVTWWGAEWLASLERAATLDPVRLPRGRTYVRSGAVGETTVRPGGATAEVFGTRPDPYRVRVTVPTFDAAGWDRILDTIGRRAGHSAALLDGELPPDVADDAASAGLPLLPGPRDLTVSCTCPDRAIPCKHAAAVCYVLADAMDADPFALLLLRGMGRDEVLAALRARRRPSVGSPADPVGVASAEPRTGPSGGMLAGGWAARSAGMPAEPGDGPAGGIPAEPLAARAAEPGGWPTDEPGDAPSAELGAGTPAELGDGPTGEPGGAPSAQLRDGPSGGPSELRAGPSGGMAAGLRAGPSGGVPAELAYRRERPALPAPLPPPTAPGTPVPLPYHEDGAEVAALAAGAAVRAAALLSGVDCDDTAGGYRT